MSNITHGTLSTPITASTYGSDDHVITDYIEFPESTTPSTPSSAKAKLYVKSDGRFYSMGDDGIEHGPFDSGGGVPTYPAGWTLDAVPVDQGYEFAGRLAMPGAFSYHGMASGDFTWLPEGPWAHYDAVQDMMYLDVTGIGDFEAMVHSYGISGSDACMPGIGILNSSGDGSACIGWSNGSSYHIAVSGWQYSSFGTAITNSGYPINSGPMYQSIKRVGTTVTARVANGENVTTLVGPDAGRTVTSGVYLAIGTYWTGGSPHVRAIRRLCLSTPDLGI